MRASPAGQPPLRAAPVLKKENGHTGGEHESAEMALSQCHEELSHHAKYK